MANTSGFVPMKIVILGADGCLASGFVGLVDILWLARRALTEGAGPAPFEIVTASIAGAPVTDGHGRRLDVDSDVFAITRCDAIIIAGFAPDSENRPPALDALRPLAHWVRDQHSKGALACGSCSGVFLLGEAGLLDARRCTTTWWLHDELKYRYPDADSSYGATLIEDRRVVTAGGPLSWIDLALFVVRKLCGPDAARRAADFAVVDTTPSTQAVYVPLGHLATADPFLSDAKRIVRNAGAEPLTARELARRIAVSERTLHRRLKQASGEAPKTFIDRIRFETARTALEGHTKSLKQIAIDAGYSDEASFRRTFKKLSGMTPGAYRGWSLSRMRC